MGRQSGSSSRRERGRWEGRKAQGAARKKLPARTRLIFREWAQSLKTAANKR